MVATERLGGQGVTMIEMLIVITIMVMVLPIAFHQFGVVQERQKLDAFVGLLEDTLNFAQMTAIAEERYVNVQFNNANHLVYVLLGGQPIKQLPIEKDIRFEKGTHALSVSFTPRGTVQGQAGTLFIQSPHYAYKLVILLGQGRFYVEPVT